MYSICESLVSNTSKNAPVIIQCTCDSVLYSVLSEILSYHHLLQRPSEIGFRSMISEIKVNNTSLWCLPLSLIEVVSAERHQECSTHATTDNISRINDWIYLIPPVWKMVFLTEHYFNATWEHSHLQHNLVQHGNNVVTPVFHKMVFCLKSVMSEALNILVTWPF